MKIGTKSILFGVHCFLIHPWFVAAAWWRLYGFPFDPRLWLAFFVHDLGYWGKPNMDGNEGEAHPETGAKIMGFLFGKKWHDFTLYHSRFYSKKNNAQYSRLCVADKLALVFTPNWLYLPMANLTGEIDEYMKDAGLNSNGEIPVQDSQTVWLNKVKRYVLRWVAVHRHMIKDTMTPKARVSVDGSGVWQ